MELLQKALFNLPRATAQNAGQGDLSRPAALDKLGLSHLYGAHAVAAAAAAASAANASAPVNQHHAAAASMAAAAAQASNPHPAPNNFGVEAVSPNIVFDVASLVLYGTHAIPVRLKILLDRLFSVLSQDDVIQILKGYGWTLEDYQRGYILKDNRGTPLERWQMCSKEEEPLVLQQFLRFGETRPITQQLILQELSERSNEENRARLQSEIRKLMERNSAQAAAAAAAAAAAQAAALRPHATINNNGLAQKEHHRDSTSSPARSPKASPSVSPSSSSVVSPKALASPNGGHAPPTSSSPNSPLNKLQSMQPFDYRKAEQQAKTPDSISSRGSIERPVPASIPPSMASRMPGMTGMPLIPNASVPPSLASYHNSITKAQQEYQMSKIGADENSHSALNLSSARGSPSSRPIPSSRIDGNSRARSTEKSSDEGGSSMTEIRKKMRDNIGMSYISPTTGKKRVQCNVCLKTFCDKGALKIHFSAVHLREMHKCTVEGCNMMFSSRRSRNRHSANPNPKLHTPHLRRKISPHDGRTHQGPYLPGLAAFAAAQSKPAAPVPPPVSSQSAFPFAGSPFAAGLSPSMLTPENLQNLQRQQMELQRLHELKMSGLYNSGHQNFSAKRHMTESSDTEMDEKRMRAGMSDSEEENKSIHSAKDEVSSGGAQSQGGSKRKSRNPTRITTNHSIAETNETQENNEDFSSDEDEEGFENPLDDIDDEDEILDDNDDNGASGNSSTGGNNNTGGNNSGGNSGSNSGRKTPENSEKNSKNGGVADLNEKENNNDEEEIPIDKENPKKCVECGQEFSNHFDVKHHYQNVHLGMMHKCTVEGCNAGFPSKRSRDRHSSNLNLHRKLLSTTSENSEILARLYNERYYDLEAKSKEFAAAALLFQSSPEKFRHMMEVANHS